MARFATLSTNTSCLTIFCFMALLLAVTARSYLSPICRSYFPTDIKDGMFPFMLLNWAIFIPVLIFSRLSISSVTATKSPYSPIVFCRNSIGESRGYPNSLTHVLIDSFHFRTCKIKFHAVQFYLFIFCLFFVAPCFEHYVPNDFAKALNALDRLDIYSRFS